VGRGYLAGPVVLAVPVGRGDLVDQGHLEVPEVPDFLGVLVDQEDPLAQEHLEVPEVLDFLGVLGDPEDPLAQGSLAALVGLVAPVFPVGLAGREGLSRLVAQVGLSVREGLVSLVARENLVAQKHLEVPEVLDFLGVRVESYRRPHSPVGRSQDPPALPGSALRDSLH